MMQENELMNELLGELELSALDSFLEETGVSMTFYELLQKVIDQGWGVESITDIVFWLKDLFFSEIAANKILFLEVLLITFCFSLLKNSAGDFGSSYISDVCFLLVYSVLALMLLKSMYIFQEIVARTIGQSVSFMQVFVPCFCTGMFFSSNAYTSAGFYQIAFLAIYFAEWAFEKIFLPCVHVYVLLQIFNHFFEETQFGNLAELLETFVNWGLKIAGAAVLGLSVVQNMINPVKDRMTQGTFAKAVSVIPGIGGAAGNVSEVLLGSGMIIKNGIGIAGIIVLLCIGIGPLLKTCVLCLLYKIMAAVTEPLSDRRISGCIRQLSGAAMLYMKIQGHCLMLFFITIALAVTITTFAF